MSVVAPATADLMAKMAQGHADDLASAILLAANRPILLAPAMNPLMWNNAATRRNVMQLRRDGVHTVGPNAGEMAEANGWKRLLTNSAKLVNIIGGYGYRPSLASLARCVDAAVAGRIV